MCVLEGLKIEEISGKKISRFSRMDFYLKENPFPDVEREHKFEPDNKSPYTLQEVLPPKEIYFGSRENSWEILNSDLVVGIIGTTATTSDGDKLAILLAHTTIEYCRESGKHGLVVAGGVYGVDEHAHYGALDLEGRTVAVVANPVQYGLHPYKPRRRYLEEGILKYGGILSEQTEFITGLIPRCLKRNRIISALSDVVVVVESQTGSGTVDNGLKALIQGVPLLVIDWDKIGNLWKWSKPIKEGNAQLLGLQIDYRPAPRGFPKQIVENLLQLAPLFKEYLDAIRTH